VAPPATITSAPASSHALLASSASQIEHVVYINLDKRPDRNAQVQRELLAVFPAAKVTRLPALEDPSGSKAVRGNQKKGPHVGCTLSHIAALEMAVAKNWSSVLVVEDDFMWTESSFPAGAPVFEALLKLEYDVVIPCGGMMRLKDKNVTSDADAANLLFRLESLRIASSQTTTAYVVSRRYYQQLLANFKNAFQGGGFVDQNWKSLQFKHRWYSVKPMLCLQRPGHSDIENKTMNYKNGFRFFQ
jgi:glycosyl transferase family 25